MKTVHYDCDGQLISWEDCQRLSQQADYTDRIRYSRPLTAVACWRDAVSGDQPGVPPNVHPCAGIGSADPHEACRRSWSWPTLSLAHATHQAITGWLTGVAAWLAAVTAQLPMLPPALVTGQPDSALAVWPTREQEGR